MKNWIEIVSLCFMGIGILGLFAERIIHDRSLGIRSIQFMTVLFIFPTILILSVEEILNTQTVATLLGALIGYLLSGISKDEKADKVDKENG